jgi:N-acetylneuraminic acid mutarotase
MGKQKGKKDVEKKIALAQRKEAKQEKSVRKRLAKEQGVKLEDDEGDELDQVLQAYKSQDKAAAEAVGEGDKPLLEPIETSFPLPRANATLCDVEGEKRECFYLFGGEYFDGVTNIFLDDLLRYEASKREWKRIMTAPRPSPRCAHSCVSYKTYLYIFGGELESGDQYHHYRDLWKFDTNTLKWTEIAAKNPPSARSGHASFVWKQYMIVFGGFFEAVRDTKWYNDVCVFNLQTETWMDVPQSRLAAKPEPRSACNIASFGTDKVIIHGGFSKMKSVNSSSETKVHSDAWVLHLAPLLQQKPPTWERWLSSTKGFSNSTPSGRAGTSSISYKSRMLVFGGVVDAEQQHHKVDSVFYNSLMALDIERRKWFPLRVKEKATNSGGRRRRKPKTGDDGGEEEEQAENPSEETNQDDSSTSNFDEEEIDPDAVDDERSGWDIDMLRHNMFAFVDGEGNIGKTIPLSRSEIVEHCVGRLNRFVLLSLRENRRR